MTVSANSKTPGAAPAGQSLRSKLRRFLKPIRQVRRDLRLYRRLGDADAALASYPKAGRTWLRYIIANYLNECFGLGVAVDLHTVFQIIPNLDLDPKRGLPAWQFDSVEGAPLIVVSHGRFNRLRFGTLPLIFMVRDPRDLMVSAYHHQTQQKHRFHGSMSEFLREPEMGIDDLIDYMNGFGQALGSRHNIVISYEALSARPMDEMTRLMKFLGVAVDQEKLASAIEASRFEQMQESEIATGIPGHDYDRTNPNGLRVRKGKVGSFRDDLSEADIAFIDARCKERLTPAALKLLETTGFS